MHTIGLDIGTTSICAVKTDADSGEVKLSRTRANNAAIDGTAEFEKLQDADVIAETVRELLAEAGGGAAIGLTGQMHGILYTDANGNAVSPLYTWQDRRGDEPYKDGLTYAEYLSRESGLKSAAGFGMTTHFYNTVNGLVPPNAAALCTIADYAGMKLTGAKRPVLHPSNADSLGLFDAGTGKFWREDSAPKVADGFPLLGETADGIPVSAAIGDNQASFIGSVRDMERAVLVNVGTGSQVSLKVTRGDAPKGLEARPCVGGGFLLVGAALCGGRSFALLERFFRDTAQLGGKGGDSFYPYIDKWLEANQTLPKDAPVFSNKFCGTRENPRERGTVTNLGIHNFTPGHFIAGILRGIAEELFSLYAQTGAKRDFLAGAGNGIRKNRALARLLEELFGLPLHIPAHTEEAAFGAGLFALTAAGRRKTLGEAQQMIQYERSRHNV
ncbi:MAG: hypothetical protein LBH54_02770 [Clostridiales bacterium]|jgi:sedoheptulokinase|nr:hypothetical protein [Clostridiales bacterium]